MDGNLALDLRDAVIKVLHSWKTTHQAVRDHCHVEKVENHVPRSRACNEIWSSNQNIKSKRSSNREVDELSNVDHNVTSAELFQFVAQLYIFEENEAVIQMIIEGRSPTMRHVSCKEYISNYRKLDTKTVYLQHEQQHEQWGQAWHKLHLQQVHEHLHAQVAQPVSIAP